LDLSRSGRAIWKQPSCAKQLCKLARFSEKIGYRGETTVNPFLVLVKIVKELLQALRVELIARSRGIRKIPEFFSPFLSYFSLYSMSHLRPIVN